MKKAVSRLRWFFPKGSAGWFAALAGAVVLLAIVFLGEQIAGYHLVAAALVFSGVILMGRDRR